MIKNGYFSKIPDGIGGIGIYNDNEANINEDSTVLQLKCELPIYYEANNKIQVNCFTSYNGIYLDTILRSCDIDGICKSLSDFEILYVK